MTKKSTVLFLSLLVTAFTFGQTHLGAKFVPKKTLVKPDSAFFGDIGVRGCWVAPDLDHDGKPEIIITDYSKSGRVHMFQAAGNDTLEWIWSSPRLDTLAGKPFGAGEGSTPRTIRTGDLDGDGRGEVIFTRAGVSSATAGSGGFLIFEWDGVNGSHKFGTVPSAIIPNTVAYGSNFGTLAGTPVEGGLQLTVEQFDVADVDGDGQQELLTPKNLTGGTNDDFLIIHAVGSWDFESQGFATFEIEGSSNRLASAKFGGGSPYAIHPADLNGDGKMELVCHNWNFADYWVIKVTGPDTYVIPDTNATNTSRYFQMTPGTDLVSLFGGIVADLDNDKNSEVYFPLYGGDGSMYVVDYNSADNVQKADSTHGVKIASRVSQLSSGEGISCFTGVQADLDRNGKQEILVGSAYPSNVVAIEYKGTGSLRDSSSYIRKVYYKGETDITASYTYRDSLGIKDTVTAVGEGFVSKMSMPRDLDGDGKVEVILPYQSLADSITSSWQHYDLNTGAFVLDSSKKVTNPKKWIFRSLEADVVGSVSNKDLTVIMPDDYQLNQNFPNPFNPSTTINFVLPLTKKVTMRIYDMLGKEVVTLANNDEFAKGSHNVTWNGKDRNGRTVASGAYIVKMSAGNIEKNIKMLMVK